MQPDALPPSPVAPASSPLVSVLVRSMDRESLRGSLDSVAAQDWPATEVVVLAAKPGHRPLPDRCGAFPMRLVQPGEPLPRARAANRAMAEARGELLLFLDDDDWLLPGHLSRLAAALQSEGGAPAAYAGATLVDDRGEPTGLSMDLPFDAVRLLAGNLAPIHAVMFRRDALRSGAKFDESLDLYEDWDFWLQLASQGPLVHVPGASAAYRIHASSGVHVDAGAGGAPALRIYDKWRPRWTSPQLGALMQRVWTSFELEDEVQRLRGTIEGLRGDKHAVEISLLQEQGAHRHTQEILEAHRQYIPQLQAEIAASHAQREREIAEIKASTSWKVTAPLRWISARLRRLN